MVSGLVTSPCDQLRIFSGDARLMRIASKSAIGFAMSKGLERYKVFLRFLRVLTRPRTALANQLPAVARSLLANLLDQTAQEPSRPSAFPFQSGAGRAGVAIRQARPPAIRF